MDPHDLHAHLDQVLIGGRERQEIVIVEYDPGWEQRYDRERERIATALGDAALRIEHIGSTSVPGLAAKPIIDVLVTVEDLDDEAAIVPPLERTGYVLRVREPGHRMLRTPARDVHVHLWAEGDPEVSRYLTFRDTLRASPRARDGYERLKRELATREWGDMNEYAVAKGPFIERVLADERRQQDGSELPTAFPRRVRVGPDLVATGDPLHGVQADPVTRVAVLNDIHGNLPALEAVLSELTREQVETILCGGDILFGPYQSECLALLSERGALFLAGNSEREVLADRGEQHAWTASRLSDDDSRFVSSWPASLRLEIGGLGRVLFCHGSPRSDEEILTVLTPEAVAAEALASADADVVVIGHTHHQFDRIIGPIRLVNAGSVGLPYEGRAGAFWTLLGPEVEFRRTEYELASATRRLRESGMPGLDEMLPDSLLTPVPRDEVAAFFERQAGREPSQSSVSVSQNARPANSR